MHRCQGVALALAFRPSKPQALSSCRLHTILSQGDRSSLSWYWQRHDAHPGCKGRAQLSLDCSHLCSGHEIAEPYLAYIAHDLGARRPPNPPPPPLPPPPLSPLPPPPPSGMALLTALLSEVKAQPTLPLSTQPLSLKPQNGSAAASALWSAASSRLSVSFEKAATAAWEELRAAKAAVYRMRAEQQFAQLRAANAAPFTVASWYGLQPEVKWRFSMEGRVPITVKHGWGGGDGLRQLHDVNLTVLEEIVRQRATEWSGARERSGLALVRGAARAGSRGLERLPRSENVAGRRQDIPVRQVGGGVAVASFIKTDPGSGRIIWSHSLLHKMVMLRNGLLRFAPNATSSGRGAAPLPSSSLSPPDFPSAAEDLHTACAIFASHEVRVSQLAGGGKRGNTRGSGFHGTSTTGRGGSGGGGAGGGGSRGGGSGRGGSGGGPSIGVFGGGPIAALSPWIEVVMHGCLRPQPRLITTVEPSPPILLLPQVRVKAQGRDWAQRHGAEATTREATARLEAREETVLAGVPLRTIEARQLPTEWAAGRASFDVAVSFSTVEHDGLGRDDTVHPDGDMAALQEIWHCLRPGGVLFLGIPLSTKDALVWPFQRLYGPVRLPKLLENFTLLAHVRHGHVTKFHSWAQSSTRIFGGTGRWAYQPVLVLRKETTD